MTGIMLSLEILLIEQVYSKSEEHAENLSGVVFQFEWITLCIYFQVN